MSRLPIPERSELTPEHQAVWDNIVANRSGTMRGPSSMLMHVPELADRVRNLEDYFRTDAALPAVDRELVILAAVREMGARFAWARHEVRAKDVGTRSEAVEVLRQQGAVDTLLPRERVLVELVRALIRDHAVSDDLFKRAMAELGKEQVVEAITLTGHYGMVGMIIQGFDIQEDSPTF